MLTLNFKLTSMCLITEHEDFSGTDTKPLSQFSFALIYTPFPLLEPILGWRLPAPPSYCYRHMLGSCLYASLSYLVLLTESNWINTPLKILMWIFFFFGRTYIISHRKMLCLCSLNQYSFLLLQQTLQKSPLSLAKVQILKILETVYFRYLVMIAIPSVKCLRTAESAKFSESEWVWL